MPLVELVARVLCAHRVRFGRAAWSCRCGVERPCRAPHGVAERHQAEEIAAALAAAGVCEVADA